MNILFMGSSRGMGITYYLQLYARLMKRSGHNVVVLASPGEQYEGARARLVEDGIDIVESVHIDERGLFSTILSAKEIKEIIIERGIEIIHVNGFSQLLKASIGRWMSNRRDVGLVMMVHSVRHGTRYEGLVCTLGSCLINFFCDAAMPVSRWLANRMVHSGLKPSKVYVVHNAVDLEEFDSQASFVCIKEVPGYGMSWCQGEYFVYLAQLKTVKGIDCFIRAASLVNAEFPETKFLVFGDGPLKRDLLGLINREGINGNFFLQGRVDHKYIPVILKNSYAAVVSSRSETFGHNIAEPMIAGKPVISTPVGVAPEAVIDGETGFLIPIGDHLALARKMIELLNKPELVKEMGRKARERAESMFAPTIITSMIEEVYSQSLGRRRKEGRRQRLLPRKVGSSSR